METNTSHATQLLIGTAGHIDHGKSALVRALTSVDPDRLPEEKARGMTIDLGFAHKRVADCDLWFVDVPGHERFIRNMVAGATGIDVALLVVAADDSVMPQTREHAEVLQLLGLRSVVVAITKCDLVDDEWAAVVEDDVRMLLEELELRELALVRTSAATGRGVEELEARLRDLAHERGRTQRGLGKSWFRLPIDRAFTVAGRGTVVTGSVQHGAVAADAELELLPAGRRVRVRDLQTHHDRTSAATGRMRLALNLANVALDDVARGFELATPGYLEPTQRLDVRLTRLRMPGKALRERLRLRLHIGTREVLAVVRLVEKAAEPELRGVYAQLQPAEPIAATWGQRFILRDETGARTLGGGEVLRPTAYAWSKRRPAHVEGLAALTAEDARARVAEVLRHADWEPRSFAQIASQAGLSDEAEAERVCAKLASQGRAQKLRVGTEAVYLSREVLDGLTEHVLARLEAYLKDNPRSPGVSKRAWVQWMPRAAGERLRQSVADWLIESGVVEVVGEHVVPPGQGASLSDADQALLDAVLRELGEAGYQPPAPAELPSGKRAGAKRVVELLDLAAAQGRAVCLRGDLWLTRENYDALVARVTGAIRERGGVTVADVRTLLDSTRKFVVPICEHLDSAQITKRVGDVRKLGSKAPGG